MFKKWFWLIVVLLLLALAVRIAWVRYLEPDTENFHLATTDFQVLGVSYQPKWTALGDMDSDEDSSIDVPSIDSYPMGVTPRYNKFAQVLASDKMGGIVRPGLRWTINIGLEVSEDGRFYSTAASSSHMTSGNCGVEVTGEFDKRTRRLDLTITEIYRNTGRRTTLRYYLTPNGFVHDGRWQPEDPKRVPNR